MEPLAELLQQRAFRCRLTPDRALRSLAEGGEFLLDRGLLTRTADGALPSPYEACHEDPYQPGRPGFAAWPATKGPGSAHLPSVAIWSQPSTVARTCWYPAR